MRPHCPRHGTNGRNGDQRQLVGVPGRGRAYLPGIAQSAAKHGVLYSDLREEGSLRNSIGPGRRCSVGCSQRNQPTPNTAEHRKAQDHTFEALHRVYCFDAWRPEPVLDVPGSELILPPKAGLLVHGCYWPTPGTPEDVLSVSDAETEAADQPCQSPASPVATDATMAAEEASNLVSGLSSFRAIHVAQLDTSGWCGLPHGRRR